MRLSNPRKFYKTLFISWGILILTLSSIPYLKIPIPDQYTPDKIAHFMEYFIFSALFCLYLYFSNRTERKIIILTLTLIIFAYLDELHQKLIPGRQFSLFDFSADFLGIITGWSILFLVRKK
jgi:VanZ family protein